LAHATSILFSVEDVLPQGVVVRKRWMIEVVGRRSRHTDPLHDGARPHVCGYRERHDFIQVKLAKAKLESGTGRFCGIATAPVLGGEPPADLDARREVGLEPGHGQPHEADELGHSRHFDGPLRESVLDTVIANSGHESVTLRTVERLREKLHNPKVSIESGERGKVCVAPGAQAQARRSKRRKVPHGGFLSMANDPNSP
jgi:hypothetical protein